MTLICVSSRMTTPPSIWKEGSLNGLLNLKMSVKSSGSWSHQILTPVTLSPFTLKEPHRWPIPVIVVWIILVKITQSVVVVKFLFEIFFFYCTKMLHHTETFITHQQHVTATRAHNPDNCDPWWRPLRHTYFFKKNSTDVWLDVKKTDFWRWYIKPITDIHGKKKPHQTLCGVCLFCSLKTLHVGNYNI